MCFIINFSQFLLVPMLIDWLIVEDYVQFDTALCNKKHRKHMSKFILYPKRFQEFIFPTLLPLSVRLFEWAKTRKFSLDYLSKMNVTNTSMNIVKQKSVEGVNGLFYNLQFMKHLEINRCRGNNLKLLSTIMIHCCNLEVLALTCSSAIDTVLFSVSQNCPKLRVCNVSGSVDVYDESILSICRQCPSLTDLNVSNCIKMSRRLIVGICVHGQQLRHLNILGCTHIFRRDILLLSFHLRHKLLSFECNCADLNDVSMRCYMWWNGSQLGKINISHSYSVSDDSLCELGLACPNLKEVNLSHCYQVSDYAIIEIVNALCQLKTLNLEYLVRITDKGVQAMSSKLRDIRIAYFFGNSNISPPQLVQFLQHCNCLTILSVENMFLKDSDVISIISQSLMLVNVNVSHNLDLTDEVLDGITTILPSIQVLHLSSCPLITDLTLQRIGARCKELRDLDHSKCSSVTDIGTIAIAEGCTRLSVYDISRCSNVTSNTLISIIENCRFMSSIIYSYTKIKCNMDTMTLMMNKLKRLRLIKNNNFSILELTQLRSLAEQQYPDLVILDDFLVL